MKFFIPLVTTRTGYLSSADYSVFVSCSDQTLPWWPWGVEGLMRPSSICCKLVRCCKPVSADITLCTLAHLYILLVHKTLVDSVTSLPVVNPPRFFKLPIKTCPIIESVHRPAQNLPLRRTVCSAKLVYTQGYFAGISSMVDIIGRYNRAHCVVYMGCCVFIIFPIATRLFIVWFQLVQYSVRICWIQ